MPFPREDRSITSGNSDLPVPGLAAAMVRDGETVWTHAAGVTRAGGADPVTADSLFEAASLSKPVVAHAVLALVAGGELDLDLDRSLASYLDKPYCSDPRIDAVTARMVLGHTTGLPNWRGDGRELTLVAEPGSRFTYSGEGYVYLQRVVERVTGLRLADHMEAEVLSPLGMERSSFLGDMRGYRGTEPGEASAAASLHTTARDYARFVAAVLNGSTAGAMFTPHVRLDDTLAWGLGWGLQDVADGELAAWHWGNNPGFRSFVLAFPARRTGAVVFTNGDAGGPVCESLLRDLFGDQPCLALERNPTWLAHVAAAGG
jgi:CubicO group peptidase (beta-lactamase class C family)